MFRLLRISIFPGFFLSAHAQSDSLLHQLQFLEGQEKLKALQSLTRKYITISPHSCMKYGSKTRIAARDF